MKLEKGREVYRLSMKDENACSKPVKWMRVTYQLFEKELEK